MLPVQLRHGVLLIDEKVPSGTTLEDAEMIAQYAGLVPGANNYKDFVQEATA